MTSDAVKACPCDAVLVHTVPLQRRHYALSTFTTLLPEKKSETVKEDDKYVRISIGCISNQLINQFMQRSTTVEFQTEKLRGTRLSDDVK